MLRRNGEQIEAALCERGRLLAEVLKLSWDQYLALTAQVCDAGWLLQHVCIYSSFPCGLEHIVSSAFMFVEMRSR